MEVEVVMELILQKKNTSLSGLFFVGLFAVSAQYIASHPFLRELGISPLIIGILLGTVYGNTLRHELPTHWVSGIVFSTKTLLRLGIVLYGFRVTLQDIFAVGPAGFSVSLIIVTSTFIMGSWIGVRFFKLDLHTAMLTAVGSSVCGAAAVLATEPVLKSELHKSTIAVATVVLFGTLTMFLYPALYRAGIFDLSPAEFGIYIGGTIHEVAHAVAAGNGISPEAGTNAVIVKMMRVMMIAPLLIGLSLWLTRRDAAKNGDADGKEKKKGKVIIPWFAVAFVGVALINSLNIIPKPVVSFWTQLDLFILTMAMCALGMETNLSKFKGVGMKPIWLGLVLFLWVTCGGYLITKTMVTLFS